MAQIITLPGVIREDTPDPDIVAMLEILLERAKAGGIDGFAFAYTTAAGAVASSFNSGGRNAVLLAGAIVWLQARMGNDMIDADCGGPG